MKKGFKSGLIVLIVLVVLVAAVSICSALLPSSSSFKINNKQQNNSSTNTYQITKKGSKNYIAAVYIEGTIEEANSSYNQDWLLNTIETLRRDPKNTAIALYINSPGGAVYQADEVYLALQNYKTSGKKIYAYQGPMAASGGYYISCAADQIWANRNTLTGSIGVIAGQSIDLTELLGGLGIKYETIHAGKNKNMGNYNEPLTDEQREILQSVADECYEQFCSIVVSNRHMDFKTVYSLADGRVYTAHQALDNGLIDRIDSWDSMLDAVKKAVECPSAQVVTYRYERKKSFAQQLMEGVSNLQTKEASAKTGLPSKLFEQLDSFDSYPAYLYK